jgi:hypothetical protein
MKGQVLQKRRNTMVDEMEEPLITVITPRIIDAVVKLPPIKVIAPIIEVDEVD